MRLMENNTAQSFSKNSKFVLPNSFFFVTLPQPNINVKMIMKKMILLALLLVGVLTVNAQRFEGEYWKIDNEGKQAMLQGAGDLLLSLHNNDSSAVLIFSSKSSSDGVHYTVEGKSYGTFSITGPNVNITYDRSKTEVNITDVSSDDPELQKELKNNIMVYLSAQEVIMKSIGKETISNLMGNISECFSHLDIKTHTGSQLSFTSTQTGSYVFNFYKDQRPERIVKYKRQDSTTGNSPARKPKISGYGYDVYMWADDDPVFPGGDKALVKYCRNTAHSPEKYRGKEFYFQIVTFVVATDGSIKDVRISKSSSSGIPEVDQAAIQHIQSMPKWKPGTIDGVPVNVIRQASVKLNP